MASNYPGPRPRGQPSGSGAGPGPRPTPIQAIGASRPPNSTMNRAEKFEDEKRRIIESCFAKKEPDGSISESYITHIRVLEDAAYPSSPPPVQSPNENKKPRIIIIAVRKSGRVRMHKARENGNGSFSIGKTWVLDDLSAILSYTRSVPNSTEEQQAKERAGSIGFVVTIQKPYYWQASTAKEKDFFIYSLIKIYKKYTGGKLPQLYGFEPQELEQFGGSPMPQSTPERLLATPQLDQSRAPSREPPQRPSEESSFQSRAASREPTHRPLEERPLQLNFDPAGNEVPRNSELGFDHDAKPDLQANRRVEKTRNGNIDLPQSPFIDDMTSNRPGQQQNLLTEDTGRENIADNPRIDEMALERQLTSDLQTNHQIKDIPFIKPDSPEVSGNDEMTLDRETRRDPKLDRQNQSVGDEKSGTQEPPRGGGMASDRNNSGDRPKRQDNSAKYAKTLGIDPSILAGRTFEIESLLNEFGWGEDPSERRTFDELQSGVCKELAHLETGSWLGAIENNDAKIAAVGDMMDRIVAECDELDNKLTLYNVELGTLSEDVAYIEAQSQGLQVQTANQKLLQTELRSLLDTISISASQLKVLKDASLTKNAGIEAVETTLTQLYSAIMTIDPKLRHQGQRAAPDQASIDRRTSGSGIANGELSSMRAVRDKKIEYRQESIEFIQRLKQYLSVKFREMEAETLDALESNRRGTMTNTATKLDPGLRKMPKRDLWLYSPLILFARDIEPIEWEDTMRMYESCARKPYQEEFRDLIFACKRMARKPPGDEQDVLFTGQERESEGIVGRKLTVKRSKTVRADGSSRLPSNEKPQDGKVNAYEAFADALYQLTGAMFAEQNSLVNLFHLTSLDNSEFPDTVAVPPEERWAGDLSEKKLFDPDRSMARKVFSLMEEIFVFFPTDVQNMVDWVIKQGALFGVGVLLALESKLAELEDSNQEYLISTLTRIHDRLVGAFNRFVDEQIHGIEDTKVKIKKRKGVIAFMKTFPHFTNHVEGMIPPSPIVSSLPLRAQLNDAYAKINKAMFESLKFIAKETPSATVTAGGDPEDKEALNYHILLIENMNHYIEEVPVRHLPVLEEWKERAGVEMDEHMDLYLSSVIRRPLGKLLDFLESIEAKLDNLPIGEPATNIANGASHSRHVAKKVFSGYDNKEIKRGIETLKRRIEKHFSEVDELGGERASVRKVLIECKARYSRVGERVKRVIDEVYEGGLEVEDFATYF